MEFVYFSYLAHHGIKNMHWGERNGPPYPLSRKKKRSQKRKRKKTQLAKNAKKLLKGTRLNSVSPENDSNAYKNRDTWMYTFDPNDKWDSKVYKGPFSVYKMRQAGAYIYEHQFELVRDLKMPTNKERVDEFIKLYSDNRKQVYKDLKRTKKMLDASGVEANKPISKKILKDLKTKAQFYAAYEIFNHAMENISRFKSTRAYAKIMAEKYDAMVDDNNKRIYNGVHNPLIIFRANEVLKDIGKAKYIDVEEIKKNYYEVKEELAKKGKKVLL